jgi:hypothetical protein
MSHYALGGKNVLLFYLASGDINFLLFYLAPGDIMAINM